MIVALREVIIRLKEWWTDYEPTKYPELSLGQYKEQSLHSLRVLSTKEGYITAIF